MISSTAKVAMPGGEPGQAHQRQPDHEREERRPRAAASSSDGDVAERVVAQDREQVGQHAGLDSSGIVMTPAANAPTATKLICPNESTPELPTKT